MTKVTKYRCDECGHCYDTPFQALECEKRDMEVKHQVDDLYYFFENEDAEYQIL